MSDSYVFCLGTNMSGSYVWYTAPASSQESAPWPPLGSSSHIPRLPLFLKLVVRFSQRGESIPLATKKSRLNIQELSEHLVFSNFDFRICFPPSGTWKPYESNVGPLKTRKQCGSSQDRSWSVFSAQEQPQEVAEVLPAAAKKASKVQLRLCSCRASHIFASFLQSATIRPIYSAFMWFVKQAWLQFFQNFDRCRRSPVWRWKHRQLPRHALVCDMMHHSTTDLTEPCRPDDQCDNATDCHCMSWISANLA